MSACQVWGGHLEPGTIVQKGVDLLIGVLDQPQAAQDPAPVAETLAPQVEIAVLPGCPWCSRALRLLRTLDLPHQVITVNDDAAFEQLYQRSGMRTFPQVFINNELIGGYDALTDWHGSGQLSRLR